MSQVVATNLVHHQLWRDVTPASADEFEFCIGTPPKVLHPDDQGLSKEYVLVSYTKDQWSVARWAAAFASIRAKYGLDSEPKRVVMAMITDDSTVVYYLVNNGVVKPRKN